MSHEDDDNFLDRVSTRAMKIINWWCTNDPRNHEAIWDDPYEFLSDEYVQQQAEFLMKEYGVDIDLLPDS